MFTLEEQLSHEAIFIVSLTARKSKQILMRGLQKYLATVCDRIVWKSLYAITNRLTKNKTSNSLLLWLFYNGEQSKF